MDDHAFMAMLEKFMGVEVETPIFKNDDGSINRERTLQLPCYDGLKVDQ